MQTSAPGGHSFMVRPSTSPVPSFVGELSSIRKSTQAKILSQTATRLRPLPGRSGSLAPPPVGSGTTALDAMCISGKQTGEEKLFTAVERREPAAAPTAKPPLSTTPTDAASGSSAKDSGAAQMLRKLEQELRKTKEQLKLRTSEKEALREKLSHQDGILEGCNKRIVDLQQQVRASELALESQREAGDAALRRLQRELDELEASRKAQSSGIADVEANYQQKLREAEAMHRSFAESQALAQQQLKDEFNRFKAASDGADKRNDELRRELQALKDSHVRELQAAGAREAKLQTELRDARAAVLERETRLEDWKSQINDCNSYIVKICQPQFSVVKDESLAPVSSEDADSGGFVLVPLHLMLEGYQILPPEMKKRIAEEYEKSKKAPQHSSSMGGAAGLGNSGNTVRQLGNGSLDPAPHRPTTSPTPGGGYTMRGRTK